jgi:hypothetical protein
MLLRLCRGWKLDLEMSMVLDTVAWGYADCLIWWALSEW